MTQKLMSKAEKIENEAKKYRLEFFYLQTLNIIWVQIEFFFAKFCFNFLACFFNFIHKKLEKADFY